MISDDNYIVIHNWMMSKLKLKGTELLAYATIYGFSRDGISRFRGSTKYLAEACNCSRRQAFRAIQSLLEKGYIDKEEQKGAKDNDICSYAAVLDIDSLLKKAEECHEGYDKMSQLPMTKCHNPCDKMSQLPMTKCHNPCDKMSHPSRNIEYKSNNISNSYPINQDDGMDEMDERARVENMVINNIDYCYLADIFGCEKVDNIVEIMTDIICSKSNTIRINGSDVPQVIVKNRFMKIVMKDIEYVLIALENNRSKVKNIRNYLLTSIYNAPTTREQYFQNLMNAM